MENLPPDVTAVLVTRESEKKYLPELIRDIEENRYLILMVRAKGTSFWARDGLPVPIFYQPPNKKLNTLLVDAKYYHGFEPDAEISAHFSAPLLKHPYYFEGGNFLADQRGNGFVIDRASYGISDEVLRKFYGCPTIIRLKHIKGIGHVDESAKLLADDVVVTDLDQYVPIFQKIGYQVHKLPRPSRELETYVNSLLVNGTIFLPTYDDPKDNAAIKVYQGLGFKVIPLRAKTLANEGMGSIHCITMTYPEISGSLAKALDGYLLHPRDLRR